MASALLRTNLWTQGNQALISDSAIYKAGSSNGDEEYDFSDVFGPCNGGEDSLQLESLDEALPTEGDQIPHALESWAPIDAISRGKPLVINHRSHSLVGPEYIQSGSLNRVSDLLKKHENRTAYAHRSSSYEGRLLSDGIVSEKNVKKDEVSSEGDSSADEEQVGDTAAILDPVCGFPPAEKKIGPDAFELLKLVGQGAFGKVFQVQKKDSGEILAMKVMRKDKIKERNHGDYMKAERDILTKAVHPFIVQLQYSFQTTTKLYLLLEFINGGHLFFQLYRQGTFNEELARLYTAEIVSAVAHLHKMDIIHRDLKPENILLDSDGHVKLTDFGLAKEVNNNDKSNSLCGTMEYMAPEIILAKGHGKPADWWSVGILLYEMLTGQPPFLSKNRQKLQQKITKDKIKYPAFLTSECASLLKLLLQKEPEKRIGNGPNGSEDIKKHKWFKCINWKKLEEKEIQPKFIPTVNGKHCIANFDEKWTNMPVQDSPVGTPTTEDLFYLGGYSFAAAPRGQLPTVDSDSQGEGDSSSDSDSETEN